MARVRIALALLAFLSSFAVAGAQSPAPIEVRENAPRTSGKFDYSQFGALAVPELVARQPTRQEEDLFLLWFIEYTYKNLPGISQQMHKAGVSFDGTLAMLDQTRIRTKDAGSLVGAHYEACYQLIRDYMHAKAVLELLQETPAQILKDGAIVLANMGMIGLDAVAHQYLSAAFGASLLAYELNQAASWNADKREVLRLEVERLDRRYASATQTLAAAIRASPVVTGKPELADVNPFATWAALRTRQQSVEAAQSDTLFAEYCELLPMFPATDSTLQWRTALMLDLVSVANRAAATRTRSCYAKGANDAETRRLSPKVVEIAAAVCRTGSPEVRQAGLIELSRALAFNGNYEAARDALIAADCASSEWYLSYRLAKLHSLTHDGKGALAALRTAIRLGYHDMEALRADEDLAWVRSAEPLEFALIGLPTVSCIAHDDTWFGDLSVQNTSDFALTNVKAAVHYEYSKGLKGDANCVADRIEAGGEVRWSYAWQAGWGELTASVVVSCDQGTAWVTLRHAR